MIYKLEFRKEALDEWNELPSAHKLLFKKKLLKVLQYPKVPKHQLRCNPHRYKIKSNKTGYRLIYELIDSEGIILVIAIGKREGNRVYRTADGRK